MRSTTCTPFRFLWNRMRAGRSWCCARVTTWPSPIRGQPTGRAFEVKWPE